MVKTIIRVAVPHAGPRGSDPAAPVYRASFTKVLFTNLYSIALSNILIFMLDATPAFFGIASALNAFAYFAGPSLFHGVSRKAGIKRSLQFLTVVDLVVLLLAAIAPVPGVIITVFIIDGLASCMFWANMAAAVNALQQASPAMSHEAIYRHYGLSWVTGGIAGELIGLAIITMGFDDRAVLIASIFVAVIQVPLICHLSIPEPPGKTHASPSLAAPRTSPLHRSSNPKGLSLARTRMIGQILLAPITLMVMAEITIQMVKGTYDFMFPFIMRDDGGSTGWIYLVSMLQRLVFMVGMHVTSKQGPRAQLLSATMAIGAIALLTVHVIIAPGAMIFILALAITSLATGMLYGYASHVLLRYAKHGAALKITAFYEAISGAGYGMILVITSLSGENNIGLVFSSLEWVLAITFIIFAISSLKDKPGMHRDHSEHVSYNPLKKILACYGASPILERYAHLVLSPSTMQRIASVATIVGTAKK
jgi:MFS family permease